MKIKCPNSDCESNEGDNPLFDISDDATADMSGVDARRFIVEKRGFE